MVSLDDLIAHVHSLHPDGDALAELREAMVLAQRLNEQSDHLIGHFVDRARRSGASWTAIGESMGVTKQAAQKRFVPNAQDEPRAADASLFQRFTPRARHAIEIAQAKARELHSPRIDTQHVLLGLVGMREGLAVQALERQGVTPEAVEEAVAAAGAPTGDDVPEAIPFAPAAKKVVQLAVREALLLGHDFVGTEHLLLALLSEEDGIAASVLGELGVRYDTTRDWVQETIAAALRG
jgi:ATP-dependent Clp protease ATP-binding subunit ClpA